MITLRAILLSVAFMATSSSSFISALDPAAPPIQTPSTAFMPNSSSIVALKSDRTVPEPTSLDEEPKEEAKEVPGVAEGIDFIDDVVKTAKDPSAKHYGNILKSAAGMIGLIPIIPWAQMIAGGLAITGALLSSSGGDSPPSNQDIMNAMHTGFHRIGVKLSQLQTTVSQVKEEVDVLVEDEHYGRAKLRDIQSLYLDYVDALEAAAVDAEDLDSAHAKAKHADDNFGSEVFGVFDPGNVEKYLAFASGRHHGCQKARNAYQQILTARMNLFTMVSHNDIHKHGKITQLSIRQATHLKEHFGNYSQIVATLHVPLSAADDSDCDWSVIKGWQSEDALLPVTNIAISPGDTVYGIGKNGAARGKVFRAPKGGGGDWTPVPFRGATPLMVQVVINDIFVQNIFCRGRDGKIYMASSGGKWAILDTNDWIDFASGGDYLYGVDSNREVWRRNLVQGGSWTKVGGCCVSRIVIDGDKVFGIQTHQEQHGHWWHHWYTWVDDKGGKVLEAPNKGGGSWSQVIDGRIEGPHVESGHHQQYYIAVNEFYIYATGKGSGGTFKAPKSGGSWTRINTGDVTSIVADNNRSLYGINTKGEMVVGAANTDNWYNTPRKQEELQQLAGRPALHVDVSSASLAMLGLALCAGLVLGAKLRRRGKPEPGREALIGAF